MKKYIDFVLARVYLVVLGMMVIVVGTISPSQAMERLGNAVKGMNE